MDSKLGIPFGEDKTIPTVFASKFSKGETSKNIGIYKLNNILKTSKFDLLNEIMSRETMAFNVVNKINNKLKFLYRKSSFLILALRHLLCNACIQPRFNYACYA